MATDQTAIGRAKTVLIFGNDEDAVAVVSTVVARSIPDRGDDRLVFTGPVQFDKAAAKHIARVVLPVVDRILRLVDMPNKTFELSVVNLAAASVSDIGLTISGFSADVPVLLALVSTALQIPVPQDVVATGHIASVDGDIRPVQNIPAKLDAAVHDPSIRRFICPSDDGDNSLDTLSPKERDRIAEAIINAKGHTRITEVAEVSKLMRTVLADEAIVLAGLQQGFFGINEIAGADNSPIGQTAQFLTQDNDHRFWVVLERYLLAGHSVEARELLLARAQYHVDQEVYPSGFGQQLLRLVQSLPPTTRRFKTTFPLLPMDRCIELGRLAKEADHDDVRDLIEVTSGKTPARVHRLHPTASGSQSAPTEDAAALDVVMSEISSEALTDKIGLPIDTARAAYVMDTVTAESNQAFNDTISAFYLHLLRHTGLSAAPVSGDAVAAEAVAILERTFAGKGGIDAGRAEGRFPTRDGGMRFVLNVMTEQFKNEQQSKHVARVLQDAVDPLDWKERVAFMAALLDRIGPQLPAELRNRPPEVYARQHDTIVQAYVKSLDRVKAFLRTM